MQALMQPLMAYLHFASIFITVSAMTGQFLLFKPKMSYEEARRMPILDAIYGASAVSIAITGFLRALWFKVGFMLVRRYLKTRV